MTFNLLPEDLLKKIRERWPGDPVRNLAALKVKSIQEGDSYNRPLIFLNHLAEELSIEIQGDDIYKFNNVVLAVFRKLEFPIRPYVFDKYCQAEGLTPTEDHVTPIQ